MRITLKTKILASIGVVWLLSFPVIGKSGNWPQFRGWTLGPKPLSNGDSPNAKD